MIRPFTLLCLLLAAGSGVYLYQVKQRTRLLDRQILQVVRQDETARQRIGILKAEWMLLNQPDRLADLAERYLALKPVAPTQFVTEADLDRRLAALPEPVAAVANVAATDMARPTMEAAASPVLLATAPVAPVRSSATAAKPHAAVASADRRGPSQRDTQRRADVSADTAPALRGVPLPLAAPLAAPLATSRPVGASVLRTAATQPTAPSPVTVRIGRGMATIVPPAPAPSAGSALGMAAATLPPPTPLAPARTP